MQRIAIDTNLLLLLVVGATSKDILRVHKRLRAYGIDDFHLLIRFIGEAKIITTPNVLTQVSNLASYGLKDQWQDDIAKMLSYYIGILSEHYLESQKAIENASFHRLGLSDTTWLCLLKQGDVLLTDDMDLYLSALHQKIDARNFTHIREQNGTI